MAGSDFFLDFGSNASQFSKDLIRDLTPARKMVLGLLGDLKKLNDVNASPTITPRTAGTAAGTSASGGGATAPAEILHGVEGLGHAYASATAELEGFMSRLGSMVARMDQTSLAYKAAVEKQNREISQQLRQANPATASLRDPNTGRVVAAGTPGGIVHPRTGQPIGQQATISGTARVLVDEAAFARVVQAVERNVDATRAVEQAVNRLNARGGVGTSGGVAVSDVEKAVTAELQKQLGGLASAVNETADAAEEAEESLTRAEKSARNRAEAAAAREGRLPAQERADRRRDIELAGSEEALRGLQKRDLRRIAGTFTAEGYDTPFNTKTTKDQFVEAIRGARQQYEAAGEVTKNDLTVSAKVLATEVSKAVRPMVDAILKAAQQIEGEEEAYDTRRLDRLTGGQDTRLRDTAGRERVQRGQVQRGAAFGGDLDRVVSDAERTIAARNERISNAAIDQALRLAQRPGFDPYNPQLRQGIQGRGTEAADARFGLAKLTAATDAMDRVAAEVIELDERLNKAQRSLAKMTQEADYFANKQKLSSAEVARYTQLLAQIQQQEARVATHQARLGDIAGHEDFLTPEFRQGFRARQQSQQVYAAERQKSAEARAAEKATSPFQAALDALVGSTTALGSASGQRAQFTRLLPGLTTRGRGATRGLAFSDAERDTAELEPLSKAFRKYGQALREIDSNDDNSPERLAELDRAMRQRLHNIIEAYERVMGTRLPTAEVEGLRTYGRPQQVQAVEESKRANQRAQAIEARERRKVREAGANLIDPASLTAESLRAEMAKQRAALQRPGGRPGRAGSEDLTGPSSVAERDARELASARETLAKAGVRFSQTLNSSLNEAKNLDDLLKRLSKAIRDNTLQMSPYHPRSRREPGTIGSYAEVAARTGNFGANPAVLEATIAAATGGGGRRGGGGGGRTAAGAADSPGGGRNDDRIVQVLNAIHATIKSGIRVTPGRAGERRVRRTTDDTTPTPPRRQQPPLYSTEAGREAFIQKLTPELQALVRGEDKVAAAAELVTQKILTQAEALGFFRSELGKGAKAATTFEQQVRAKVGDTRLSARGNAAEQRRQLQERLDAAGGSRQEAVQRQQLRQQSLLADTMGRLTPRAKAYVDELRDMIAKGRSSADIAQQQVKVYAELANVLGGAGFKTPQIRQRAAGVFEDTGSRVGATEMRGIAQIASASKPILHEQGEEMGEALRGGAAGLFGDHGFWSRVVNSTGTFIIRNFSAGFVFGLTNALQQALQQAIETEAAFVKVSSSLEATGRSTAGLRTALQQISTDYGVALQDVYETTASLVGLFNTPQDLAGAARVVAQLQLISRGALNAAEATSALASITSSFGQGDGVAGLEHIADVLTVIQERVGVNIETTAEGVARMSGLAQQVGLSFEETAVFVGEIAKKTGQTGAAAGEQFSRIIATLQTGRGRQVLQDALGRQNLGRDTGIEAALSQREYGDVIKIVMENYEGLTKAQQDNIAVTLGGQRQAAAINALFADGAKTLGTLTAAQEAQGQGAERAAQFQEVLDAQMTRFGQNITNLADNILRSGIADSFVAILTIVNNILGTINSVFSKINEFAEGNPLIGFLQHATLGMVGLAIAIVAVRKALAGVRGALSRGGTEGLVDLLEGGGGLVGGGGRRGDRGDTTLFSSGGDVGEQSSKARRRREAREEAREQARIRRQVAQEEQGRIRGGLSATYEGGALRAQARQEALLASAERQKVRREEFAEQRRDQRAMTAAYSGDLSRRERASRAGRSLLAGTRGRSPSELFSSGFQRVPGAARAAEASTRGAAKALGGVSTALAGMAGAAGPASAALAGVAVGLLYMLQVLDQRRDYAKRAKEARDASFGPEAGLKTQEQKERERYIGPASTIREKDLERQETWMGKLEIAAESYVSRLTDPKQYLKSIATGDITGGLMQQTIENITNRGGQAGRQIRGDLPKEYLDRIPQVRATTEEELKKQYEIRRGQTPFVPGYRGRTDMLTEMLEGEAGQVEDILRAQESATAALKEAAAQAEADKGLSEEQKTAYAAELEKIKRDTAAATKNLILQAQGLGDVNALTLEQIKQVDEVSASVSGLSSSTAKEFELAIKTAIKAVGAPEGSRIKPLLDKLATGGMTQVEQLKSSMEITKAEADAAQAEYVSLQAAGVEKEQVDEARSVAFQKINQYDQLAQQIVQAEVQAAQELATFYTGRGEYAQATQSLDAAVAALRSEANKPGQSEDRKRALNNEADSIAQQNTQIRITAANESLKLEKSRTQNQVDGADLELKMAKQELDIVKQRFDSGGATRQQVVDAGIQYNQALQGYAAAVHAQSQAGYAAQSAQTLNAVAKAQIDQTAALNDLAYAEKTYGRSSSEYKNALARVATTGQAASQATQDLTQSHFQLQAAQTNDPATKAGIEMKAAAQAARYAAAKYGTDSVQYKNALASLWNARLSYAQTEQDLRQSEFAVAAARTMNAASKASIEALAAGQAYLYALSQGNRVAANQALAQQIQAQQAARQARQEEQAAARETKLARIAPSDAVGIARQRLANARAAQRDAAMFGKSSTQYQQATQAVIDAVRAADEAVQDVLRANSNLAVALAEAAGRTVDAARLRYNEARKEWLRARTKSGGRETAEVKNAKAAEVAAGAAYRDAILQDKLDTIDFNQQMGTITAQGAIAALQKILKATNLTQQQRREIMLKIKGLQDDLRGSLTASGFNIPDQIKLPTPYEVRRSLGIDKYQKLLSREVNRVIAEPGTRTASDLGATVRPAAAAPTTTTAASSTAVVAALDSVRQAVVANGAQVVNDIEITNQVSTPAMVEAVARRVVELISTSTTMGARANQASPKLVSY